VHRWNWAPPGSSFSRIPTRCAGVARRCSAPARSIGGRSLRGTGPERTLLDGFRHPDRVGGLQELVESAAGFGVLDLALLRKLLETYGEKRLWAAAGWFLERHQQRFFVPHEYLASMAPHRPAAPRYLERGRRGGKLFSRWNLIVPPALASAAEPDEA